MFRLLVTHMPDVAWTSDSEGRTIYVSPQVEGLCGLTPEECCSATSAAWFERVHPDDRERVLQHYRSMFEQGTVMDVEYRLQHRGGRWVWVHHRAVAGLTKEGHRHSRGVLRDISDAKEAREALRRSGETYRDLFDNAMDAIFIVDADFRYVDVNKRATELFGYTAEEFRSMRIFDLIPPDQTPRSAQELERLHTRGAYEKFRGKMRAKDGRWHDIEVNSSAIVEGGSVVGSRDIVRDITEQLAAEREIEASEGLLRSVIDSAPFGAHFYELQEDGQLVFVGANRAADRILGVDNSQYVGKTIEDAFPALRDSDIPRAYRATAAAGTTFEQERVAYKDAQISGAFEVITAQTGKNRMAAFFRDTTERKKIEEKLREEKNRSEAIIAAIGDGISIQDRDYRILYQNEVHKQFVGDHEGELCFKAYESRDGTCAGCPVELAFTDGQVHITERVVDWPEGCRYFEISASPLRDASGTIVAGIEAVRDITSRKRAEESLWLKDAALASSINAIALADLSGTISYANQAFLDLWGLQAVEAIGKSAVSFWESPDEAGMALTAVQETSGWRGELVGRRKDGSPLFLEVSASMVKDSAGRAICMMASFLDITRRKHAEEDERRSRERLELLIDRMPMGCIMWDSAFRVSLWNPMAEQIFGYSADEALGRHAYDLIVPGAVEQTVQPIWERLLKGDRAAHSVNANRTRDGRDIVCEWFNTPLRDAFDTTTGVLSMVTDVTERVGAEQERQKLQEQLLQSQKMEAIGLLAGGVAHDFNNILSAILGYASIMQMKMRPDDPLRGHVEQVLAASRRAADLTRSLLAFSRKQIIHPRPLEVNEGIRRIEKFLRRLIGEDIEFVTRYHESELRVMADPTQLEQVIVNLATNARDAMPNGGILRLTTEEAGMDEDFIRDRGYGEPGRYARIAVSDTGQGIDDETRAHIFEPFFTTKELGKGTGLGLSTVYGIVKQSNGYILCESERGAGTTFSIYLPLTEVVDASPDAIEPATVRGGAETILIAEDDDATRSLFQAIFEEQGYTVITAANGAEAIERFRERADEIRLLVLDVIMPKKNGREVHEAARRIRPDIKTLFTSGYTADIIHSKGVLDPSIEFLAKPVVPADMLKKARGVLDET